MNEHRVPPGLQEPFVSGVNALVAQAPRCTTGEGPTATTPPHIVTSSIAPVPHAATPAQQARNLQAWLSTWSH